MSMAGQAAIRRFLAERGAGRTPHSGRTLLDHLAGTARILESWGCSPEVSAAGFLHSVYGTNAFSVATVAQSERDIVIGLAGAEAERLAFLFSTSERPRAFLYALRDKTLRDRRTGETTPVPAETAMQLIEIECANLIEQRAGQAFVQDVVTLATSGSFAFKPAMLESLNAFLQSSRRATGTRQCGDLLAVDGGNESSLRQAFAKRDYVRLPAAIPPDLLGVYYRYARNGAANHHFKLEQQTCSLGRYADAIGEVLLEDLRPGVERITGRKLLSTYSFLRFYTPDSRLEKHVDRRSCEYSLTIAIGKESTHETWPIMLEHDGKTVSIELGVGDALLYKGAKLPHWRDPLSDGNWLQLFVHYVDAMGSHAQEKYDRRRSLGPVAQGST